MFRGRLDVYPRRWENPRTGRSGYSPACAYDWREGLCAKLRSTVSTRRSACFQCAHQAYLPVNDDAIAAYLRGE